LGKKSKKSSHISHIIRIAIAAAAFLYFVVKNNPKGIIKDFGNLDILVFLVALGFYVAGNFVFVLRWLMLLRAQHITINYLPALKLHFLGLFYNNCLPGSVGGDALRAWYVTVHTDKKIEAALSVFVDRAVGMVCTLAMAFLAYWLMPAGESEGQILRRMGNVFVLLTIKLLLGIFVLVVLAAIVLAIMYKTRKLRPMLLKYTFIFALKWKIWVGRITTAIKLYCSKPFTLLLVIILSFICQAMPIYGLYLVGKNLGIEAHIKYYYIFFPLSWIIGAIPISVGGVGVIEFSIQGMFKIIGVSDKIPTLALAQRLTWILTSIPGVIIHLTGKHLPDKKEIEEEIKAPI